MALDAEATTSKWDKREQITRALQSISAGVGSTSRQLADLRQRRAAERAASANEGAAEDLFEQDPDCCVCYEPLERPHAVVTACGHVYHRICIANALETSKNRCPICRRHVDHAELVQVMNGLPTRKHDENGPHCRGSKQSIIKSIKEKRQRTLSHSLPICDGELSRNDECQKMSDGIANALDSEIIATLEFGRKLVERLTGIRDLEDLLNDELCDARKHVERVKQQSQREKEDLLTAISKEHVSLKVQKQKLEEERQGIMHDRNELREQIANARKRADMLSIAIKSAETAQKEAENARAATESTRMECEERKLRYQALVESLESKAAKLQHAEGRKIEDLTSQNRLLRNKIVSFQKEIRNAKKNIPFQGLSNGNSSTAKDTERTKKYPVAEDILAEQFSPCGQDTFTTTSGSVGSSKNQCSDDSADEDDVVSAANRKYCGAEPSRKRKQLLDYKPREDMQDLETSNEENSRMITADMIFGTLLAPRLSGEGKKLCNRPPPPRVAARRKGTGRPNIRGLAEFRPKDPLPALRPGAVAARNSSEQFSKLIGVKRMKESSLAEANLLKTRTGKIDSFFQ